MAPLQDHCEGNFGRYFHFPIGPALYQDQYYTSASNEARKARLGMNESSPAESTSVLTILSVIKTILPCYRQAEHLGILLWAFLRQGQAVLLPCLPPSQETANSPPLSTT